MIIEDLDFNGSSDILQYIPTIQDEENEKEVPMFQERSVETSEKIKPPSLLMEFSTPISDVVPSADFDAAPPTTGGPYRNPQNNKVVSLSLDNTTTGSAPKTKNPFGLNDEQFHAAVAGAAAIAAFSKPVQNKLSEMIPQFTKPGGDLSVTGIAVTAFIAAMAFYILMKVLKPK
jgi:hypothetical protein